jgi:RNA polymerase sigma factor for flagellar operon FliA
MRHLGSALSCESTLSGKFRKALIFRASPRLRTRRLPVAWTVSGTGRPQATEVGTPRASSPCNRDASAGRTTAGRLTKVDGAQHWKEENEMEALLRDAKQKSSDIPPPLKEQIVLEHTPLIRYIVNRIAVRLPSHIDLDDLHNTGVIGLMDAIEKYDPDKNCKFKTYAEFRIKGAILDQLRSLDWVPRSVRQKSRKLERAYGEVEQRLGRVASEEEVADSLGLQIEKFHELLNQVRGISMVNLEEVRGTNSDGDRAGTFADIIEDVNSENPFATLKLTEMKTVVADTIASLPEKERLVISLYYYEDLNMKEIGGILGITESRVCQIHTKSVLRLRSKLKGVLDRG